MSFLYRISEKINILLYAEPGEKISNKEHEV